MSLFVSKPNTNLLARISYANLLARPVRFLVAIIVITLSNLFYQLNFDDWSVLFEITLWNPTWLLMGPLLLMAKRDHRGYRFEKRMVMLHAIPFLLMSVFFVVTTCQRAFNTALADQFYEAYQYTYVLMPLSLAFYAWLTFNPLKKKVGELASMDDLLLVLSGFYALIAAISAHLYLCWGIWKVEMVIDYRIFIYALSLTMVALIAYYLHSRKNVLLMEVKKTVVPAESSLIISEIQLNKYEVKLQHFLVSDEAFLNPDLSLDLLSRELQIPKYHLSILFNQHLGQSFYSHLARLRINYAMKELLKPDYVLTLEALAYKCGFNSKTCFHKYFREYTGLTPSAYVKNQRG